jgi:hypothetical protein
LVGKSRPAKASSETVRTCPVLTLGSSSPAGRRCGLSRNTTNSRPDFFSAVDPGRLFRFRDRLARSLLAQSAHAV